MYYKEQQFIPQNVFHTLLLKYSNENYIPSSSMFDFGEEKLTLMTSGMAEDPFPRETNFTGENYKKSKQTKNSN